jgi:trehalose 6-phosphate phosphatase
MTTVDEAVARCLDVLEHHPAGLFSDFDGTLSTIAPIPDAAFPFPGATEAMASLNELLDHVAIITGRAADTAQDLLGVPDIQVIGNHGLEMIRRGKHTAHPVGVAAKANVANAMGEIQARLEALTSTDGMIWENKVYSASIHFRNTTIPDIIETHLRPLALEVAARHDLRITGGKMMFELRPSTVVSKGTALADLIADFGLKGAIFIGDDVTDVDGFEVLHGLKDIAVLAVGVMSEETHPSVLEHSDILLSGVADVVAMLQGLAASLKGSRE